MKTKLKSMSKRTLSILLVLLMVVSTVTVGVLTTTAAYTELDNEAVGASADVEEPVGASVQADEAVGDTTYYVRGSFNDWRNGAFNSSGQYSINLSAGEYTFKVTDGTNWWGKDNTTIDASTTDFDLTKTGGNVTLSVSTPGTYVFKSKGENGGGTGFRIDITFPTSDPTDWYVIGNQMGDKSWSPTRGAHMTQVAGTTEYTVEKDFSDVTSHTFSFF